jgi:hypothetical protein
MNGRWCVPRSSKPLWLRRGAGWVRFLHIPARPLQQHERCFVREVAKELVECQGERATVPSDFCKECQTRSQFQVVRIAEYLSRIICGQTQKDVNAFAQTRAKNFMGKITLCLFARFDTVIVGGRTSPKSAHLRKDEPHPMCPLPARAQFGERLIVNRMPRFEEPFQ